MLAGKNPKAEKGDSLTGRLGQLMQKKGGLLGGSLRAVHTFRLGSLAAENQHRLVRSDS